MTCSVTSSIVRHVMGNTMTKDASEMTHKPYEIYDEMARRVQIAALPVQPTDSVKARIMRASIRLGLQYQRVRSIWYRAALRIEAHEADLIRARTAHLGELQHRMQAIDALLDRLGQSPSQLSLDLDGRAVDARRPCADTEGK